MKRVVLPKQKRDWTGLGVGFLVGAVVAIILAYAVVQGWL